MDATEVLCQRLLEYIDSLDDDALVDLGEQLFGEADETVINAKEEVENE